MATTEIIAGKRMRKTRYRTVRVKDVGEISTLKESEEFTVVPAAKQSRQWRHETQCALRHLDCFMGKCS